MSEAARNLKLNPWHARAEDLARRAMLRLVNRTDRFGKYYVDQETQATRPCAHPAEADKAKQGLLTHVTLARHYRAGGTADVVGVYSYGADKFGKWLCIDIDNHDDKGDTLANENYAVHVARKSAALGLCVLLYESNGKGGFHLWVLFDGAVVAAVLRGLGNWLVSDSVDFGFAKPPEVFPKNNGETEWGNWVRLPGRHHTRDVWPRVWNGEEWVRDSDAVEYVLSLAGCDPEVIPAAAATHGIEVHSGGREVKPAERPKGVVFAWEDFNKRVAIEDLAALLERHGWSRGKPRGDGAIEFARPGKTVRQGQGGNLLVKDGLPIFYCFTDGAAPLKPMCGYAPAALVAILEHGGQFKESNAKLYEQGYGTRVAKKKPTAAPKAGQEGYEPNTQVSEDEADSELVFASVAGIVPEAVHYLVPGYIPRGMVGMLAGDGGHGKSMITLELAAALSSGRCAFGMIYPKPPTGKTLLISCEDDWQRTILPRLAALGANRKNILRVEGVRMKKDGKVKLLDFHMGHYAQLERALVANPDILLIVIDPAGAYIGRAGVNENQDAELRSVLGPLSEAANRTGACVLLIKHLNKSAGVSAVQRVGGGGAYVNAVRFSYMVAPDPDDADKKLILPLKTNVLKAGLKGMAYRMEDVPHAEAVALLSREWPEMRASDADELAKQLFRPKWEGDVTADANSVSGTRSSRPAPKQSVGECQAFLRTFLGEWAWPEKEVEEASRKAGFSFSVYKQAKTGMRTEDKYDPARLSNLPIETGGAWWMWIGSQYSRPQNRPPFAVQSIQTPPAIQTGQTSLTSSLLRERENTEGDGGGSDCDDGQSILPIFQSGQSGQSGKGIPPTTQVSETGPQEDGGVL
jgi:hypothetical protein